MNRGKRFIQLQTPSEEIFPDRKLLLLYYDKLLFLSVFFFSSIMINLIFCIVLFIQENETPNLKLALKSGCISSSLTIDTFETLLCQVSECTTDFQRRNSVISFPPPFFPFPLVFLDSLITVMFSMCLPCRARSFLCFPLPFHIILNGPLRTSPVPVLLFMALTSPLKVNSPLLQSFDSFTANLPAAFYKNRKTAATFIGENEGFSLFLTSTLS